MARKLVVTFALDEALESRIAAAAPEFEVSVLGREAAARAGADAPFPSQIQALTPVDELQAGVKDAEVVFCHWDKLGATFPDFPASAPHVRWVQLSHAGAESVNPSFIERGIMFTTSVGMTSRPIAEYVLGTIIMFCKGWPALFRAQQSHVFRRYLPSDVRGKTVGIIGMGQIGGEVATLAKAFGCRVIGMRRSVRARTAGPVADEVVPVTHLPYLLSESDFVVIAASLTDETRGMIGAAQLGQMKPTAYLINVARGQIVDEPALIEALRSRTIAGAALDVFAREPLAPDSPLWDLDNAIVTPHISGGTESYWSLAVDIFCANLARYRAGEPLSNLYLPNRGY
jgi:phosphoglycerate dehydrogenase-like enzyme